MRVSILPIGIAALCAIAGTLSASRAVADDIQSCARASGEEAIAACTRAIDSARYNGKELATQYFNRAVRLQGRADYDRAIADYSEAIRLDQTNGGSGVPGGGYINRGISYRSAGQYDRAIEDQNQAVAIAPRNARTFYNRGVSYSSEGEYARAIEDYGQAIGLDPRYANALRERGRAYLLTGAVTEALADLDQAGKLAPRDAYTALWLDMASQRSGLPSELTQAFAKVDMTAWPAALVQLFMGRSTAAAMLAAADSADANTRRGRMCEANFYGGEFMLRSSSKEEATRLFQLAAKDCPYGFSERDSAITELRTLRGAND